VPGHNGMVSGAEGSDVMLISLRDAVRIEALEVNVEGIELSPTLPDHDKIPRRVHRHSGLKKAPGARRVDEEFSADRLPRRVVAAGKHVVLSAGPGLPGDHEVAIGVHRHDG